MFRTEGQRAAVCRSICTHAGLQAFGFWDDDGATEIAIDYLERDGGPLSSGERIMFLVAWSIWNGEGNVRLDDVAYRLDGRNLTAVASLLACMAGGADDVDRWLVTMADMEAARAARS